MKELSVFVDESGDKSTHARYFLLTVVIHDQADKIAGKINTYEQSLAMADLPNIPFHSEPLLNGHKGYTDLSLSQRKKLFIPLTYWCSVCQFNTQRSFINTENTMKLRLLPST